MINKNDSLAAHVIVHFIKNENMYVYSLVIIAL